MLIFFIFAASGSQAAEHKFDSFLEKADGFLKEIVTVKGIDYQRLQAKPDKLTAALAEAQKIDVAGLSGNEAKSYWINLYNLMVIRRVMDNYPMTSPKDINGFFKQPFFRLGQRSYSLDDIEKGILFKKFPDPRLHFILVCAAQGCPPLAPFAYYPDGLDTQLDAQTAKVFKDRQFIRLDEQNKMVRVSEIFRWYIKDFPSAAGGILGFINKFRKNQIPEDFKTGYYTYNWRLNGLKKSEKPGTASQSSLETYTPAVLLPSGGFEIKIFNNLYTQTAFRDINGDRVQLDQRQSYYTASIQLLYGISKHRRLNIGLDLNLKSVFFDTDRQGSPFSIFSFSGDNQRTAITTVGPKIKIAPFKSLPQFSLQSSFLFPVSPNLEGGAGEPFLEYQRSVWWTQLFFDFYLSDRVKVFSESDFLLRFKRKAESSKTQVVMPTSVFLNYFPRSWVTVYGMVQYAPTINESSTYYWQTGVGGKFQLTANLELELLVTSFIAGSNSGAGVTYNIGLRYIKQ